MLFLSASLSRSHSSIVLAASDVFDVRLHSLHLLEGFGSHTPMVTFQTKVVRYFPYAARAMRIMKEIIKKSVKPPQMAEQTLKAVEEANDWCVPSIHNYKLYMCYLRPLLFSSLSRHLCVILSGAVGPSCMQR